MNMVEESLFLGTDFLFSFVFACFATLFRQGALPNAFRLGINRMFQCWVFW